MLSDKLAALEALRVEFGAGSRGKDGFRWHDALQEYESAMKISAPEWIALARAAEALRVKSTTRKPVNLPHRPGCICAWCEDIEVAQGILWDALASLDAALPVAGKVE